MKRRSFLKRVGALIGLAYVNPITLIPDTEIVPNIIPITHNCFMAPNEIAAEALTMLEDQLTFQRLSDTIIKPAARKLADAIDQEGMNGYTNRKRT